MSAGGAGVASSGGRPVPAGYIPIVSLIARRQLLSDFDQKDRSYFNKPKTSLRSMGILEGEIAFTFSMKGGRDSRTGLMRGASASVGSRGYKYVRTCFNGIVYPPGNQDITLNELRAKGVPDDVICDVVMAAVEIAGVTTITSEVSLDQNASNARPQALAIQEAGLVRLNAYYNMPFGSMIRARPPTRAEFTSPNFCYLKGQDRAKIPMITVPVNASDFSRLYRSAMWTYAMRPRLFSEIYGRNVRNAKTMENVAFRMFHSIMCSNIKFVEMLMASGMLVAPEVAPDANGLYSFDSNVPGTDPNQDGWSSLRDLNFIAAFDRNEGATTNAAPDVRAAGRGSPTNTTPADHVRRAGRVEAVNANRPHRLSQEASNYCSILAILLGVIKANGSASRTRSAPWSFDGHVTRGVVASPLKDSLVIRASRFLSEYRRSIFFGISNSHKEDVERYHVGFNPQAPDLSDLNPACMRVTNRTRVRGGADYAIPVQKFDNEKELGRLAREVQDAPNTMMTALYDAVNHYNRSIIGRVTSAGVAGGVYHALLT